MHRELLLLRMPTGEEAGAGQQIYGRLAGGGMAVPIPAVWHRRPDDAKKRDKHPLSGMPISFLWGLFTAALFDEVREFLGKTRERISP